MGKRKSKRNPPPKQRALEPLERVFNCPFCNHERSCEVTIDRTKRIGRVSCRICKEEFQKNVSDLDEEVDVYSEWIDACETANNE